MTLSQAAYRRAVGRILQARLSRRAGNRGEAAYAVSLAGCARRSMVCHKAQEVRG